MLGLSYKKQKVNFEDLSPEDQIMQIEQKKLALQQSYDDLLGTLEQFVSEAKGSTNPEVLKLSASYVTWLLNKTNMVSDEKTFVVDPEKLPKRGEVYWIDFGFNVGSEFGGRHPAIVLRSSGGMVIVLPLSTQKPYPDQMKSGVYVEVDYVRNFKDCRRWVNVLNLTSFSLQRVDFSSNHGHVNGSVLDKINESIIKSFTGRRPKHNPPKQSRPSSGRYKKPSKTEGVTKMSKK